eukprot:gene4529-4757_t
MGLGLSAAGSRLLASMPDPLTPADLNNSNQGNFSSLWYALGLNEPCNGIRYEMPSADPIVPVKYPSIPDDAVYVAPTGLNSDPGTLEKPLQCIQTAVDLAASRGSRTVVLRAGTHHLAHTLALGPKHSGIHIMGCPGEDMPVVSGGVELKVSWTPFNTSGANIFVADVSGQVTDVPGLLLNGVHATRARYPNIPGGLETSCGYGCMVPSKSATWTPPDMNKYGPVQFYTDNITSHDRPDTPDNWFQHYMIGIKGLCSVYDPPVSYWCSEHPSGGGAFAFRTPSGITPQQGALPNHPYKDPSTALFFVWRPARWANWMCEVGNYNEKSEGISTTVNCGFIENVMEELDYPGEFFFDKSSSKLYLYYNGTGSPPSSMSV